MENQGLAVAFKENFNHQESRKAIYGMVTIKKASKRKLIKAGLQCCIVVGGKIILIIICMVAVE